ncbi:hypothetical protein Thermo_00821 [Thermoplasmatales archaeon]|nr:hypothetical protein Thermo_00821 [Thermoplasmatales archaeon]
MIFNIDQLYKQLKTLICDEIEFTPKGVETYLVTTPFCFDDGDGYVIYIKRGLDGLYLTDGGHTMMHLSYWMDTNQLIREEGERSDLFNGILRAYHVAYSDGRLIMQLPENTESFGNYFLTYIQAITKITDIDYLSKERVRKSFLNDLVIFLREKYGERAREKWSNPEYDKAGTYSVDIRLDLAKVPIYVYAAWSNERALSVVVSILTHRERRERFRSLVIHEYVEELSKPTLKKIMDASDKQISGFYGKQEEIAEYIKTEIEYIGGG